MFQLWKIQGVMKFGWSRVTIRTSISNSCNSLRFCFSMAARHSAVTTTPREPIRLSRATEPAISGSPWSSSRRSRSVAWARTECRARVSAARLSPVGAASAARAGLPNGTSSLPRQKMLTVNRATIRAM